MKQLLWTLAALSVAGSGCQTSGDSGDRSSRGYPDAKTGNVSSQAEGTLVLHRDGTLNQPGGQAQMTEDVGFSVRNEQGHLVKHVTGSETTLAPGRYLIYLEEFSRDHQPFWVTIESRTTTEVDVAKLFHSRHHPAS